MNTLSVFLTGIVIGASFPLIFTYIRGKLSMKKDKKGSRKKSAPTPTNPVKS